jgi:hypothetical protein
MDIYRTDGRVTTMQRFGAGGVTVVITESPDGTAPRWTIGYYPVTRTGRQRLAFTESSQTASIPDRFSDVLKWAKHRWDEYASARQAA